MNHRRWLLAVLFPAALLLASCATVGLTPDEESMPAARAALAPEYRLFFDALEDYGDWTLIEPYGYVFRPYNNVVGWRPYAQGYWAASDVYGWVWISGEPFGWATYHYGNWIFDRYQGWVWIPGTDWAPAWVAWDESQSQDYVGWAPLGPNGYPVSSAPGGGYVYVPTSALASTDVATKVQTAAQIGERLGPVRPVDNPVERGGVRFNAGPRIETVERRAGPITRVRVEDALPAGTLSRTGGRARTPAAPAPAETRAPGARSPEARPAVNEDLETMRRAAEESARRAREAAEAKASPPAQVEVVRPPVKEVGRAERERVMPQRERSRRERPREAAPDSSGR